jgi:hypothetical protein
LLDHPEAVSTAALVATGHTQKIGGFGEADSAHGHRWRFHDCNGWVRDCSRQWIFLAISVKNKAHSIQHGLWGSIAVDVYDMGKPDPTQLTTKNIQPRADVIVHVSLDEPRLNGRRGGNVLLVEYCPRLWIDPPACGPLHKNPVWTVNDNRPVDRGFLNQGICLFDSTGKSVQNAAVIDTVGLGNAVQNQPNDNVVRNKALLRERLARLDPKLGIVPAFCTKNISCGLVERWGGREREKERGEKERGGGGGGGGGGGKEVTKK